MKSEYVLPPAKFGVAHGSSIVSLPNNELLSCYFAGKKEAGMDIKILCSRKENGKWSNPKIAVNRQEFSHWSILPNKTVGNTVLHLDRENRLWLFYVSNFIGGWAMAQVSYKVSTNFGKSWTRGRKLTRIISKLIRTKIIELENGNFILPLYHEFYKKQAMTCVLKPKGKRIVKKWCKRVPGNEHIQPAIVKDKSKDIYHVYMRNMKRGQTLYTSFSSKNVKSPKFSKVIELDIPNPNSSIDVIDFEKEGALAVFNNHPKERTPLSIGFTTNYKDFKILYDLETGIEDYSYPYIIKGKDNRYHLTYTDGENKTIKYVNFSIDWVRKHQ